VPKYEKLSTVFYNNQYKRIIKKFSKSLKSLDSFLNLIQNNPEIETGHNSIIVGYKVIVRKVRFPLKEYNISERKGIRLIFSVYKEKLKIAMLDIYCKSDRVNENKKQIEEDLKTLELNI
jgi:hypothetical protein